MYFTESKFLLCAIGTLLSPQPILRREKTLLAYGKPMGGVYTTTARNRILRPYLKFTPQNLLFFNMLALEVIQFRIYCYPFLQSCIY